MTDAPLMLSVSGCRGIVGRSLTPETAARFAGAFAGWLNDRYGPGQRLVLARDGRAGGESIHAAALAGLTGAGCHVTDLGIAMTPTAGVMVDRLACRAGMVVTASHNPQQWNGLKCLLADGGREPSAAAPPKAAADEIIARFQAGRPGLVEWSLLGRVERCNTHDQDHVEIVISALEELLGGPCDALGEGRSFVLDSVNASGVIAGPLMLEALGVDEILHLGGEPTGLFPHPPEPIRENLTGLSEAVRESGAAAGFAQDPDADRLAIVDEIGNYIGEEFTLALGALAVLEALGDRARGCVLATNLSTSRMLEDIAARFGASVVRTPVGEANVVEAMKAHRSVIGGEGNGGVIWPAVTYIRDSLSAMALVTALLRRTGKPLSELVGSIPAYAIEKRKVDLPSRDAAEPAVRAVTRAYAAARIDTQDGVRVDWLEDRAWLHVRASNTEPIMRLIAEAPTLEKARAILDDASRVIAEG
ncbi:MAG: hypothetical protein KF866_05505 [Phycisphaeraceae bacterium]|nr:hypothetical protein [Phycisphaeraceae bacterium]MCW5754449.1 hypothetical protein [Phycisphaeraceae bacterium]